MKPAAKVKALRAVWARIPQMADCRGLCADSCRSPFDASSLERDLIRRRTGKALVPGDGCTSCSMLSAVGRCTVYGDRPTICRVFGTAPSLRCQHGCAPTRWLTDGEAVEIVCDAFALAGANVPDGAAIRAYLEEHPGMMPAVLAMLRG